MEIRKILYVLLVGFLLCMIFAGVLKYMEEVKESKNRANGATTESVVQTNNVPEETPTKEPTRQIVKESVPAMMEPVESLEETMEPIDEPTLQPEETMEESERRGSQAPVKTAVPTRAPISEPPQKQEEITMAQDTPQPIRTTEVPRENETPTPQYTSAPMPTQEPTVVEEEHTHEFEKSVWELPACGKGGYYNNVCKSCGFVECVSLEPLSHETEDIVIQEGNCMEDRVIRHVCKLCGEQTESDTRYPVYDEHQWGSAEVDGMTVEYCEQCGIVK